MWFEQKLCSKSTEPFGWDQGLCSCPRILTAHGPPALKTRSLRLQPPLPALHAAPVTLPGPLRSALSRPQTSQRHHESHVSPPGTPAEAHSSLSGSLPAAPLQTPAALLLVSCSALRGPAGSAVRPAPSIRPPPAKQATLAPASTQSLDPTLGVS